MTALRIPRRIALPAAALAALAVVGISVQVNLARLCSPAAPADRCSVSQADRVETAEALRRHIAANPAASDAYVRLVTVLEPEVRADAIHAANRLAPQDPNLILARAQLALSPVCEGPVDLAPHGLGGLLRMGLILGAVA